MGIFTRAIEAMLDATRIGGLEGNPVDSRILSNGVASREIGVDLSNCCKC